MANQMTPAEMLGDATSGCPCCDGRDTGDTFDLCDRCLDAALEGRYQHGCARGETDEREKR